MPKTVVLDVPDTFDFGKLVGALGSHVEGMQILKPNQRVHVVDQVVKSGRGGSRKGYRLEGKSVVASIMGHFTPSGIFTATHAQAWVHQSGYNMHSASPALTALKKGGLIEQVGSGKFRFVRPLAPETNLRIANQ